MPEIYEASDSPDVEIADSGHGGSASAKYHILDCPNSEIAGNLARGLAPLAVQAGDETLVRQTCKIVPDGFDKWIAELKYGSEDDNKSQEPPTPGTWKFSFDTTGGRQTITTAKLISRHWNDGFGEAPDLQGAINWDGKTCHGVEIIIPALKFQITAYYEPTAITPSFMREVARKTARMNTDEWLGFETGELLYFGGQGQGDIPTINGQRVQPIAIVHQFEASENLTLTTADTTFTSGKKADGSSAGATVVKRGWDYFWTWFKKRENEDFSKVVGRPAHGYVHETYRQLAFAPFFGFGG